MWQIVILLILVYIGIKGKQGIVYLWEWVQAPNKDAVKPSQYRKYNPYVYLGEVIHWEVIPAMGEGYSLIRENIDGAIGLFYKKPQLLESDMTIQEVIELWDSIGADFKHYDMFRIYLVTLQKKAPKQSYKLAVLLAFLSVTV